MPLLEISDSAGKALQEVADLQRSGQLVPRPLPKAKPQDDPVMAGETVYLLANLTRNTTVPAVVLREAPTRFSYDIALLGWPSDRDGQSFSLYVNSELLSFPLDATAEEFQRIAKVPGLVLGGTITGSDGTVYKPYRWFVSFDSEDQSVPITVGPRDSQDSFISVERTLDIPTNRLVNVRCAIPTGWTTPLRAGAICETFRRAAGQYRVIGAEARYWYHEGQSGSY